MDFSPVVDSSPGPDPEGVQGVENCLYLFDLCLYYCNFIVISFASISRSNNHNPLFSNRRGLIILYNFIRKEKISNAINNC